MPSIERKKGCEVIEYRVPQGYGTCCAYTNGVSCSDCIFSRNPNATKDPRVPKETKNLKDIYTVIRTQCNCHPETCCCDDWTIMKNGEKFTSCYLKTTAEQIAKALNYYEENEK